MTCAVLALGALLTEGQSDEWKQLFNGRDLTGWEHVGPGGFVVEDGLLKTEGGMGLLWYTPEKNRKCGPASGLQNGEENRQFRRLHPHT